MTWINHLLLGLVGLAAGGSVAAGTFAFLVMLGVIPRMVGRSKTAKEIMWYENAIILGGICGNLATVFLDIRLPFGHVFAGLFGIAAGIFVGCNAMALAEALKAFPILFRRMKLKVGLSYLVLAFALGKTLGSLLYFFRQIGIM